MRKPSMSSDEHRSFSPTTAMEERRERNPQFHQEARPSSTIYEPPPLKSSFPNGYSQSLSNANAPAQNTNPSSSYNAQRQPINDAVTTAFDQADSQVSPDQVQLITQIVIQQLQAQKSVAAPQTLPVQPPGSFPVDQPDNASSFHGSPSIGRATVYTPPSPHRHEESTTATQTFPTMPNISGLNMHGYQTSRKRDLSPLSRGSNEEAIMSDSDTRAARPEVLRRTSTDPDATVLEKHWGKLFDEEGQGTRRLEHFLKGIANHLIEEVEPKHSLVVTPDKMQKFYESTQLEELPELYPWRLVFDDKTSSISRLLRDPQVKVQHHLVQPSPDARPDIPGLTPTGFATWVTLLIKAHPDHEYERITKILRTIAINHPEERSRRFPAAISRRLLPVSGDQTISSSLQELMVTHCKIPIRQRHSSATATAGREAIVPPAKSPRKSEAPPPPTVEDAVDESRRPAAEDQALHRASVTSTAESTTPRRRDTMARSEAEPPKAASVTSIEDDGPDDSTPRPILERERKPYVAQLGGGKSHDITSSSDEKQERRGSSSMRRTKSVSSSQRPRLAPQVVQQRGYNAQQQTQDGNELSRSRTTTIEGPDGAPLQRSRSNSQAYAQPHPFRRSRSNTQNNEQGRYHAKRSPSTTKNGFDSGRTTAPDLSMYSTPATGSYPPYPPSPSLERNEYSAPSNRHSMYERLDARADPRSDPRYAGREASRDREYDPSRTLRPRLGSTAGADGRPYYDDSYRGQQGYPVTNGAIPSVSAGGQLPYPPSAYR